MPCHFKNKSQQAAVMTKLTKGEKYFVYDCMKQFEEKGQTLGTRIMARNVKRKVRYL